MHPGNNNMAIMVRGTINAVIGKAKARKTVFVGSLAARASYDKKILWIDTEQSDADIKNNYENIKRQAPATVDDICFTAFMNSSFDFKPFELLEELIKDIKPDLVVIDNVTDFDDSTIMESATSSKLVRKISKLAKSNNLAIIGIIHMNESKNPDDRGRGHIGGEFQRKSHTVIKISLDADPDIAAMESNVKFVACRLSYFKDYKFIVDKDNTPQFNDLPFNNEAPRTAANTETMEYCEEQTQFPNKKKENL